MSVLYKALQKAEKENELRQSATETHFDTQRLEASGAMKFAGKRGANANRIAMAVIVLVAVAGGGGFLLFKDDLIPVAAPARVAAVPPPAAEPVLQPPAMAAPQDTTAAAVEGAPAPEQPDTAAPQAPVQVAQADAATEVEVVPEEDVSAADQDLGDEAPPAPARPATAKPAVAVARSAPARAEPMPQIPVDSPARMLNPPISVTRSEFAFAGVGDQVQVREVSQSARSNVSAGYDALVRGSYDAALSFYDAALKEEPSSVLALLGRGASLQKMARGSEAHGAYEQVLKLDPQNREALTNVTAIISDRSPQDALERLIELEREYPGFSPIKAQIGLNYAKMGNMQQALDYLRRATALSPEAAMYHYNLALVLDHMGRREQAISSYERVLDFIASGRGSADLSATEVERRVRFLRGR